MTTPRPIVGLRKRVQAYGPVVSSFFLCQCADGFRTVALWSCQHPEPRSRDYGQLTVTRPLKESAMQDLFQLLRRAGITWQEPVTWDTQSLTGYRLDVSRIPTDRVWENMTDAEKKVACQGGETVFFASEGGVAKKLEPRDVFRYGLVESKYPPRPVRPPRGPTFSPQVMEDVL